MSAIYKSAAGEAAVRERYSVMLDHWPVPNERLRLPTSWGETFVMACGPRDAPALILLHGSALNSAMWMGDVASWSQHFRVYAVDMIGEPGFSAPSRPPLASGAYVAWLEEVMAGLGAGRASMVGISLGGWLALEFATNRPERVTALALLCPGGVGRHRNILFWALPLLMLGSWGRRRLMRRIGGPLLSKDAPPHARAFGEFMRLIFTHFRPRKERLPRFGDEALRRLTMPVMAVLGGKDVFIDSAGTRSRLAALVPPAEIHFLPEAGHFLPGQTGPILDFLLRAAGPKQAVS
jgi:pimeloyl-ACP methyl ester carboxylesterase